MTRHGILISKGCFVPFLKEKKLINAASCQQASLQTASWASPENTSFGSYGIVEHNQPTASGMTDSSNRSGLMIHGSSASSLEEQKHSKVKTSSVDRGSKITVKATYKEDIIRFKFEPSAGCLQLYEEVAKEFKVQNGTFQLKYLDDEDDWIMLVTDLDLQECLEILDGMGGRRIVKLLVREMPCNMSRQ